MENWLRTDETQEAVLNLQLMSEQISKLIATSDPHRWIWVVIGLHNALQGFMVLALRGTNSLNVLTQKSAEQWMREYENNEKIFAEPQLDKFLNLYKKIKSDRMKMYHLSEPFVAKGNQGRSVRKLNSFRNEFIHFIPKGWSIELSGFPQIVDDCLDVIYFLAFVCGNVLWHDHNLEIQTRALIEKTKAEIALIRRAYSGESKISSHN